MEDEDTNGTEKHNSPNMLQVFKFMASFKNILQHEQDMKVQGT